MAEKWTNTSSPPSWEMNPKPFDSLNHFTVPLATISTPDSGTTATTKHESRKSEGTCGATSMLRRSWSQADRPAARRVSEFRPRGQAESARQGRDQLEVVANAHEHRLEPALRQVGLEQGLVGRADGFLVQWPGHAVLERDVLHLAQRVDEGDDHDHPLDPLLDGLGRVAWLDHGTHDHVLGLDRGQVAVDGAQAGHRVVAQRRLDARAPRARLLLPRHDDDGGDLAFELALDLRGDRAHERGRRTAHGVTGGQEPHADQPLLVRGAAVAEAARGLLAGLVADGGRDEQEDEGEVKGAGDGDRETARLRVGREAASPALLDRDLIHAPLPHRPALAAGRCPAREIIPPFSPRPAAPGPRAPAGEAAPARPRAGRAGAGRPPGRSRRTTGQPSGRPGRRRRSARTAGPPWAGPCWRSS